MDEFENGITFTDEEAAEEVKKQLQDAEDALKFENSDADTIAKEFDGVASRCENCIKKLDELYNGGSSFESAEYALDAFRSKDMSISGFIPLFSTNKANKKLFESLTPNLSPDFIKGKMLYLDSVALTPLFKKTCAVLTSRMDLKVLFAFKMAYDNFQSEGFSKTVYENIQVMFMSGQVIEGKLSHSQDLGLFPLSEDYYAKFKDVLEPKQMGHTYWQFRSVDLNNLIKNDSNLSRFINAMAGDGPFYPKGNVTARLQIIDRYTKAISKHKDTGDNLKKLSDICSEQMASAGKLLDEIKHPSSKNALLRLGELYKKLGEIADDAYEHYKKFKDSDDSPYVFMKYPEMAIKSEWVGNSSGWEGGTKYFDAIWKLADYVSDAFEDAVYQQGRIKRN